MSSKKASPGHKMTEIQAQSVDRGGCKRVVVVALDESSHADEVFDFVCSHFNNPQTLVVFTYVAKPLDSLFHSFSAQASEAQKKAYLAEGWVKRAEEQQMQMRCVGKVLVGDAREELITFCDHLKPDCLVVGSHGRNALSRLMLGSVSSYCVHFCNCPVIVVKPTPKKPADDSNVYSSVVRLAAKTFNMQHLFKDSKEKPEESAAEEASKKEGKEGGGGVIELEDVVPMENPFPEKESEDQKFPVSDAPFPTLPQAQQGGA